MPVFRTNKLRWLIAGAAVPPDPDPGGEPGPATHYVAPAGVASGSGVGTYLDPWTWQQAFADTSTGKVIEYRPGLYDDFASSSGPYSANVPHPGEPGSPNVHRAQYAAVHNAIDGGTWSKLHITSGSGSVIGLYSHTQLIGFDIQQTGTWSNTVSGEQAAVTIRHPSGSLMSDVKVSLCRFDAVKANASASNWSLIYMQDASGVDVSDCLFMNMTDRDANTPCIELYSTENYNIHHNLFDDCATPIFIKGLSVNRPVGLLPGAVHHNHMLNVYVPIHIGGVGEGYEGVSENCLFYQNLIDGWSMVFLTTYGSIAGGNADSPSNLWFVNNTFVNGYNDEGGNKNSNWFIWNLMEVWASSTRLSNSRVANNIIGMDNSTPLWNAFNEVTAADLAARIPFRNNIYQGFTTAYGSGSWAAWQSSGMDVGGAVADPLYTNAAGKDFTLQAGSPAIGAGLDELNLLGGGTSAVINAGCHIGLTGDVFGIRPAA